MAESGEFEITGTRPQPNASMQLIASESTTEQWTYRSQARSSSTSSSVEQNEMRGGTGRRLPSLRSWGSSGPAPAMCTMILSACLLSMTALSRVFWSFSRARRPTVAMWNSPSSNGRADGAGPKAAFTPFEMTCIWAR